MITRKGSREVKMVVVIFTTSPTKCPLVNINILASNSGVAKWSGPFLVAFG